MDTNRGINHIFENPITAPPENNLSSLIQSLSSPLRTTPPPHHHSFTEIFGELHFKDTDNHLDHHDHDHDHNNKWRNLGKLSSPYNHRRTESSETLQLCTEGLGFESLDNLEDLTLDFYTHINTNTNTNTNNTSSTGCQRSSRKDPIFNNSKEFPPPISSIGGGNFNNYNKKKMKNDDLGKPWIFLKSYREEGRLILKEIRIPTQECLHASREDGRLRLSFVHQSTEEEEEEDEEQREGDGFNGDEEEEEEEEEEEGTKILSEEEEEEVED